MTTSVLYFRFNLTQLHRYIVLHNFFSLQDSSLIIFSQVIAVVVRASCVFDGLTRQRLLLSPPLLPSLHHRYAADFGSEKYFRSLEMSQSRKTSAMASRRRGPHQCTWTCNRWSKMRSDHISANFHLN